MSNAGVLSLLISLKDSSAAGEVTPGQLQEYLDQLKRKLSGNGAGAMAGLDLPLDVHKIGYSPDEMALDKLINYYESRICALMGVDPMVCGLGSGTMQKTYANLGEALNDFWERQIVPMLRRHASTLTAQLFPSFGMDASEWRLSFDTSEVAALQENVDALFTRWRELWQAGGIDLYTLQTKIGLPLVPQEYKERFFGDKPNDGADASESDAGIKVIDRNGMSHDELGRFDGGAGGGGLPASDLLRSVREIHHFPPEGILPGGAPSFWGGEARDETTKRYFNGKYPEINVRQPEKVDALAKEYFGGVLKPHDWGKLVGAPDGCSIDVKVAQKTSLDIKLRNSDLITGLAIRAVHQNDGSTPSRCFLQNVEIKKGPLSPEGLAPRMLAYQFQMARTLGIDRVVAVAAGSAEALASGSDKRTGFSRWPQLGFDAYLSEQEIQTLPSHLKGCRRLNDLMLRDGGFEYWKSVGTGRTVEFDLSEGSNSWLIFDLYLSKKNIRTK